MNFVKRKTTTAESKLLQQTSPVEGVISDDVVGTVTRDEIPMELILNWDQTGMKMVPSFGWTMDQQGAKRFKACGVDNKRSITAVFFLCVCGSLTGDFLPLQVIYKGKTCHPIFEYSLGWPIPMPDNVTEHHSSCGGSAS